MTGQKLPQCHLTLPNFERLRKLQRRDRRYRKKSITLHENVNVGVGDSCLYRCQADWIDSRNKRCIGGLLSWPFFLQFNFVTGHQQKYDGFLSLLEVCHIS